jgi:hypothetical protein
MKQQEPAVVVGAEADGSPATNMGTGGHGEAAGGAEEGGRT